LFGKKPNTQSVVSFIVEEIEKAIIEKGLKPGDKLPPSRELQSLLGTSQGTLREALRALEQKGLIGARPGRNGGIYVKAVTSNQIGDSLGLLIRQKQVSQENLSVFRSSLEVTAASLAAIDACHKEIMRLKRLKAKAEEAMKRGLEGWHEFYRIEDRMHQQLARMTGNPLFETVLTAVYKNYPNYNHELIPLELINMAESLQDWEEIINSVETGRPDKASWAMTRHIHRWLPLGEKIKAVSKNAKYQIFELK